MMLNIKMFKLIITENVSFVRSYYDNPAQNFTTAFVAFPVGDTVCKTLSEPTFK